MDAPAKFGIVFAGALVLDDRVVFKGKKTMSEPGGYEQHKVIFRGQVY